MRTRIYNARILTMEEKRPVFKGEIYICLLYTSDAADE